MSDLILGLHAGVNSAAAIARDGRLVFCVPELTGIGGYAGYPLQAVAACLDHVGATPEEVTAVAYGSRFGSVEHCPPQEYQRWLAQFHRRSGAARVEAAMLEQRPDGMQDRVRQILTDTGITAPVTFYDHHMTHAATAYFALRTHRTRPYLVLTCDGSGDAVCAAVTQWQYGHGGPVAGTEMRDSLGMLWFWLTHEHGYHPCHDETALMELAPYADPARAAQVADIFRSVLRLDRGGLRLSRTTEHSIQRVWPRIARRLRGQRLQDVCGGLQLFTEDLLTTWVANAVAATGISDVLVAGGVFTNARANQRIAALPEVTSYAAFPSGEDSLAIGAVYQALAATHDPAQVPPLTDLFLGPDITAEQAAAALKGCRYDIRKPEDIDAVIAQLLADGAVVGRAAGRLEFGAQALGNGSLLANPANPDLSRTLRQMLQDREFWMPFASVVQASQHRRYFRNRKRLRSPYMTLTFDSRPGMAPDMIAALHPADLTGRVQIIPDKANHPLAPILAAYQQRSGNGILLHAPLHLSGRPLARTAADAVAVLAGTPLQYLQLGPYLVDKGHR